MASTVGFVGAGSMGGAMVERLLGAGTAVQLYARRPEAAEKYAALGAGLASSVAELAAACDVIVMCPFSEVQVEEIMAGPDGVLASAKRGTVVVQHATVSIGYIESLTGRAANSGITVIDAPISGTSQQILDGQLIVLAGGPEQPIATVEPLLGAYAMRILHTGGTGTATRAKLVNNLAFAGNVQVAGSAIALAEQLGVDTAMILDVLATCSARSFALDNLKMIGSVEAFGAAAAPYLKKDVAVIESVVKEHQLSTGALGEVVRNGPFDLTAS